jgi:transcriptional regulator with XRE-family HTH domain
MAKKDRSPSQPELDQIADRLRVSRLAIQLTPAELCRATGIAQNTWSQYENAKSRPRLDEARMLRKAFGWTLDWIYEGDPSGLPMKAATAIAELQQAYGSTNKTKHKAA